MPGYDKIPTYLNPEQRHALTQIPSDLSDRDIARHYTFTEKERELINRRRRASHRIGFAVQLALLKFPGRTLMEVKEVPRAVLTAIAEQVDVPASAFTSYGERENTLYEHLDELRRECGFRSCGWKEYLLVAKSLLPEVGIEGTTFTLVLAGGVFRHPSTVLEQAIIERVRSSSPDVRPTYCRFEPVIGVLFTALEAAGGVVDGVLLDKLLPTIPDPALFSTTLDYSIS